MSKKIKGIDDLQHDPNNANKGNERGRKAVDDSLTKYGAGRHSNRPVPRLRHHDGRG